MMVDINDMRVMQVLSDATNVIAEGEVLQLMNMHDATIDEAAYLRVIRSKTAKLFEASARLAPILAGTDAHTEALCAEYGQALGTAFQVIDDVLDYEGSADELGKNLGMTCAKARSRCPSFAPCVPAPRRRRRCCVRPSNRATWRTSMPSGTSFFKRVPWMRLGSVRTRRPERAIEAAKQLPVNAYSAALLQLAAGLLERRS